MFSNIGGLEVLFVLVVALVVLGPTKLPEAARRAGKYMNEVRRISGNFQRELREAVHDPIVEAEARAKGAVEHMKWAVSDPFTAMKAPVEPDRAAGGPSATDESASSVESDELADPKPAGPAEGPPDQDATTGG